MTQHQLALTSEEQATLRDAMRRDAELSDGTVRGRSHAEVMKAARKLLQGTPRHA